MPSAATSVVLSPEPLLKALQGTAALLSQQCADLEERIEAVSVANASSKKALRWLHASPDGTLWFVPQLCPCWCLNQPSLRFCSWAAKLCENIMQLDLMPQ